MKSPNTYAPHNTTAFTLIEILIVVSIFSALAGMGLVMSMQTFRSGIHRSEVETVVSLLQKARSRALAHSEQSSWGVCYVAPNYLLFKGSVCTGIETTPANTSFPASFSASVIFSALSATTTGAVITVTEKGQVRTITVNGEGMIVW